jgi:hypothetical protein
MRNDCFFKRRDEVGEAEVRGIALLLPQAGNPHSLPLELKYSPSSFLLSPPSKRHDIIAIGIGLKEFK